MSGSNLSSILQSLGKLIGMHDVDRSNDGALLEAFAEGNQDAFAALVRRHGPMVWGVCRRMLRDDHAAEDAFQAAFLVLARKARSIRRRESPAGWLYRVAFRLALAAKPTGSRPESIPDHIPDDKSREPFEEAEAREVREAIDEEVNRLPEKYRLPVVLCFFEGRTHGEAAAELRWPIGTVAGRLSRAKELLHRRLTRRGVTPAVGALGALLAEENARAVPPALSPKVVEPSLAFASGGAAPGRAAALAKAFLLSAARKRAVLGLTVVALLSVGVAAGVAVMKRPDPPKEQRPAVPVVVDETKLPALRIPRNRMMHAGVICVVYSPDGTIVASGGKDGTIRIWDVRTGRELTSIKGYTGAAHSLAFSPNGSTLAAAWKGGTIAFWDVKTRKERSSLKCDTADVTGVAYSPDGKMLATATAERTIKVWNLSTGKVVADLAGHADPIGPMAFSRDGTTLASGSKDRTVRLWDITTGKERRTLRGEMSEFSPVAFSPDGKVLATGSWDNTTKLWDVQTGMELEALVGQASGVAFSPDGTTLVSCGGNTIKVWNAATLEDLPALVGHTGSVRSVAFGPDGRTLVSAGEVDGCIKLWDVRTAQEQASLRVEEAVQFLAYSPDGRRLAVQSGRGIRFLEVPSGKETATVTRPGRPLAFSPDGNALALANENDTIGLLDVHTGEERVAIKGYGSGVYYLAFSPDGRTLAWNAGNNVKLWDVPAGKVRATLVGHTDHVFFVAFSPDGRTVATAGGHVDMTIRLWDTMTGKGKGVLQGHTDYVFFVSFSPDGKTLASAARDGTIKLWEPTSGKVRRTIPLGVYNLAFSPDGRTLAWDEGATIKLSDAATGKDIAVLRGHTGPVKRVAFSPDGGTLVSVSEDKTIKFWDVSPER